MALQILDAGGSTKNLPTWVDPAYSIAFAGLAVGAAPTTIVQFKGNATNMLRQKRIAVQLRAGTGAGGLRAGLARYSTAASGGTPVSKGATAVKHNINNGASSVADADFVHFTAAPTAGTKTGDLVLPADLYLAGTTADATSVSQVWDFAPFTQMACICGATDFINLYYNAISGTTTVGTAQTLDYQFTWDEAAV